MLVPKLRHLNMFSLKKWRRRHWSIYASASGGANISMPYRGIDMVSSGISNRLNRCTWDRFIHLENVYIATGCSNSSIEFFALIPTLEVLQTKNCRPLTVALNLALTWIHEEEGGPPLAEVDKLVQEYPSASCWSLGWRQAPGLGCIPEDTFVDLLILDIAKLRWWETFYLPKYFKKSLLSTQGIRGHWTYILLRGWFR